MKEAKAALFCLLFLAGMIYIAKKDKESKQQQTSYIENLRLDHSEQVCSEPKINNELP